jgi:hypothetical protein
MAANERPAPGAAFLAERYWPGVNESTVRRAIRRLVAETTAPEATAARNGAPAQVLACAFVPREQSILVVIRARSDAVVAELGRRAGVAFDRIVEAVVLPTGS